MENPLQILLTNNGLKRHIFQKFKKEVEKFYKSEEEAQFFQQQMPLLII
jgi:hypothetical protein